MKKKEKKIKSRPEESLPGYPTYPPGEDIYAQAIEEVDLNPEDILEKEAPKETPFRTSKLKSLNYTEEESGDDLDIPGSELDDLQEEIGSEDEENNYYSLGGDDHENLEEDKGE
jgi:hypothetical protein